MPKISWGDAKIILENIVGCWKDVTGKPTKAAYLSRDWLQRTMRDKNRVRISAVVGVETDEMFYTSPYENYGVGFIDDAPQKRWPHECRYVFISRSGERSVMSLTLPPVSEEAYKLEQVIPPPDKRVIVVKAQEDEKW